MSFIRKGFFEYRTFKKTHEAHTGRILLSKPGYEHTIKHIDKQPDITTVFEFKSSFFTEICEQYKNTAGWFLDNNDIHSVILSSGPEQEYLHHGVLQKLNRTKIDGLEIDEMVIELLEKAMGILDNKKEALTIPASMIRHHLVTGEKAREYILEHFNENISLAQLAQHCCVSTFHFSRIFKAIFDSAPHQFLAEVRLNHAKFLLGTTDKPVADIAFNCGFNSAEHFAAAYRQRYQLSPSAHRRQFMH